MRVRNTIAVGAGTLLIACSAVVAVALGTMSGVSGVTDTADAPIPVSAGSATAVCGFPGALIGKIVADRAADEDGPTLRSWPAAGDGALRGLRLVGDDVVIERDAGPGSVSLVHHSRDGSPGKSVTMTIPHDNPADDHNNGQWAVSDDGTTYAIDSYDGHRRILVFDQDGAVRSSFDVPDGPETTEHPLDLQGVTWVADLKGSPAILVGEGRRSVHGFRTDGTSLGLLDGLPDTVLGAFDSSRVFGQSAAAGASTTASLRVAGAAGGELSFHAPFVDREDSDRPTTPAPRRFAALAPAPNGDGVLMTSANGVEWMDAAGARRGIWAAGQNGFSPADPAAIAQADGTYWMLVDADGQAHVAVLTAAEMAARFTAPVALNAGNESVLASLGLGLGAVTDAAFNHFDAGTTPHVLLRTEAGWGNDVVDANRYEVRYTVTGDPTLAQPVVQGERPVSPRLGGGDSPLELPEPRPGVYEVSLALIDKTTGQPTSGSCLRYSIGAPDDDLALDGLADGEDWGGPGPLRGVQLADRLGIGSHRTQLDFGSLIPDATATPDAAAVDWSSLPGAAENDPFAGLRSAARYAAAHDVDLIMQVGAGGDAESAAVDAGTWGGWASVIVAEFARQAPQITHWEAWNEPNLQFDSGARFAQLVEIPFADAAHGADPEAFVLGVNTLGFANDWWADAAAAGVCNHIDAVAIHPYTGWNRSWEEEGFSVDGAGYDAFREAIGPECASLPLWDTESGWTGDGASAFWVQGSNVTRKLLWYQQEQIAGWTYFFSEGGWGENNLSWSLVQHQAYLKPGALTFAATSRLLADRGVPESIDTGIPFTHAMRFPGDDTLVAVWTDEARMPALVTTDAATLTVVDQYGARGAVATADGPAEVMLTAAPQFFRAAAGAEISFGAISPFGPDLLAGREVAASSTHVDADPQVITSGTADPFRPWRSGLLEDGTIDEAPAVTVTLDRPSVIDRVAVAGGNIVCCEAGLRHYTVSVKDDAGKWHVVAQPDDLFWERVTVLAFEPVVATAVKVEVPWTTVRGTRVLDVNFTGFAGGLPPPFMGLETTSDYVVSISAIQAWAPAP